jgi:uncharacterized protein (UPF0335 family)
MAELPNTKQAVTEEKTHIMEIAKENGYSTQYIKSMINIQSRKEKMQTTH